MHTGAPCLLVVAGHDPTGGAGVAADREAARALGARPRCVVTAWTDQDGRRVRELRPRAIRDWSAEARVELANSPAALKSGLLPSAAAVEALVDLVREGRRRFGPRWPVVVDPVLAASGGEPFLDAQGQRILLESLVPLGVLLTPNLPELARLCAMREQDREDEAARVELGQALCARGAHGLLIKGGHGSGAQVRDLWIAADRELAIFERPRLPGRGMHGSGCRLASAFAAALAGGAAPRHAARDACAWMGRRLSLAQARGELRPED